MRINNGLINNGLNTIFDLIKSKKFIHYFRLYLSIFIFCIIISTIIGLNYIKLSAYTIYFVKNFTSIRYGNNGMTSILAFNLISALSQMYIFYFLERDKFKEFLGMFYFSYMGSIGGLVTSRMIIQYNTIIALGAIAPHGIIEIPAVILAISTGMVLHELKNSGNGKKSKFLLVFVSLILFFLLGIAAYIESNITPSVTKMLISYYHLL